MVLFHRTDFINLTICAVAIFVMQNIHAVSKNHFRYLVGGIFISLVYDILWLVFVAGAYAASSEKADGGTEDGIRKFSMIVSVISFVFRIFMAIVFWKDSLDYERIMLQGKLPMVSVSKSSSPRSSQYLRGTSPKANNSHLALPY